MIAKSIFCYTMPLVLISGLLTFVFAFRRRTLYRLVEASEDRSLPTDPYELADKARARTLKKSMIAWGIVAFLIMLVSLTWQAAVITLGG